MQTHHRVTRAVLGLGLCITGFFAPFDVAADTYVSGPVSGIWTPAGNPYITTGDLQVLAGAILHIEAGVIVRFGAAHKFEVYGILEAAGTAEMRITFEPMDPQQLWGGVRFCGAEDGCYLQHCDISDALAQGSTMQTACGGGIYSENCSPSIAYCHISDCRSDSGGSLDHGGGGIFCVGGMPRVTSCIITECTVNAFCTSGGAGIGFYQTDILIAETEILDCIGHGMGGGIRGCNSEVSITHCVIANCGATHYAGGVALIDGCTGEFFDNLIVNNVTPDIAGGGIYLHDSPIAMQFCTVAGNVAGTIGGAGGGLYHAGGAQPTIRNSVFYFNRCQASLPDQIQPMDLVGVTYCDIELGYPGTQNFDADPLFVSRSSGRHSGYFLAHTAAGQAADSPCIDRGDASAFDVGLHQRTTRTDGYGDQSLADLGYHRKLFGLSGVKEAGLGGNPHGLARPNPFRHQTTILLSPPESDIVSFALYDAGGRRVVALSAPLGGRERTYVWDGRDAAGRRVPAGTYFLRFTTADGRSVPGGRLIHCR